MTTLHLRTLGQIGLYDANRSDLLLAPGKPLALLIYLCLTPGRRISRDFLLNLLWVDLEPDRARRALRQALFHLRRVLGEDALPGTEELTLVASVEVDRDVLLAAIERGEIEPALDMYGGDFLPAFGVPGGVAFEHWADLERDRLRGAFLRCSELVVRRQLNEGRFRDAQRLARRAHQEAPDSEAAWCLLLEAVISSRDFVSAAVEADAVEQWAAREGIGLAPGTRSLIAAALQVTPGTAETNDASLIAELTGREREFAAITSAWDNARTEGARLVHIVGRAGLGKTRLLRDAVARMRAAGARVVEASGNASDQDIPFAFAADLALALCAVPGAAGVAPAAASTLIALNPALSSYLAGMPDNATGNDALRRRIHAFSDLIHAIAHEQPFVLVIDDVHWLDSGSLQVLDGFCNRLRDAKVLCLTAARSDTPAPGAATVLTLAPLSEAQVSSFVSALGGIPSDATLAAALTHGLYAASGGSPLLILETLRLALDEGILSLHDGEWTCGDETRLSSLLQAGEALRHRVRALPAQQAWLLGVIATLAAPVDTDSLAAAVGGARRDLDESLRLLQQHGLLTRAQTGWMVAHDEIAVAARAAISARQQEANRLAGTLLLRTAAGNQLNMQRGMRHLVAASDYALLRSSFVAYVRKAREQHDARSFTDMARDVTVSSDLSPHELMRALPLHWRLGLWSRSRQRQAAAVLLIAAGVLGGGMYARDARTAALQRVFYADAAGSVSAIAVQPRDWDGRSTALIASGRSSMLRSAALAFRELAPAVSPDRRSVAWIQQSSDSTTLDIWLRTPSGTRRLTRQFRDDLVTAWLPDGSGLLGMTNRWASMTLGGYDVAVFDTASGLARPVTRTPEHEGAAAVSTDGTRVAFIREVADGPALVCVTAYDGLSEAECRRPAGHPVQQIVGWSGPNELVLILDAGESRPLVRHDWQRNQSTTLFGPYVYNGQLSPDRRWVVVGVRLVGIEGIRDWIIPVDRPTRARRVDEPADGPTRVRWWEGAPDNSQVIERVEFTDTTSRVLPGVSTRLAIRALTSAGNQVPFYAPVRWSSSDPLIASVDATGTVHPHGLGAVTITASLAGWRRATKRIEIVGVPVTHVFEEKWDPSWPRRWIAFGDPPPIAVEGPGGQAALWTHGDGEFLSFAVQRAAYSAKAGIGVEIRLSTRLIDGNHLRTRVILAAGVDTAAFRGADQRIAAPSFPRLDASCAATFPVGDGRYYHERLGLLGGTDISVKLGPLAQELASGRWWTLRLQILPDGRCGFAVNGKVMWVSTQPIPLEGPFRLWLGDESLNTKLLHGPLEQWTGVRTDIDWSQLGSK